MTEAVPQGGRCLNPSLASSPTTAAAAAGAPFPVLSNARIAGRCRVVDCEADLSIQTNTNRKYYLCRDHWAAEAIIVEGIPQRFCGQCSRFKILSEYDGSKRTCRQCLLLRNTKKMNRRYEDMQRGAYRSSSPSFPPNQLSRDKYVPSSVQPAEGLRRPSLPTTAGLYSNGFHTNNNSITPHNTSAQMALLQQQLLQLQQGLPAEAPALHRPPPQQAQRPLTNFHGGINGADITTTTAIETINVHSLDTVLGLMAAIGSLGDGHTGNIQADSLYYLFQELKTLKHDVERKGVTLASMEAKRRRFAAEQELAKANLEVATIEEQLTQRAVMNKQHGRQQHQGQGLGAAALAYQMLEGRITRPAPYEANVPNNVINQSTNSIPTINTAPAETTTGTATLPRKPQESLQTKTTGTAILPRKPQESLQTKATGTATLPQRPQENLQTEDENKAGSGSAAPDSSAVHVHGVGPASGVLALPPDAKEEPN